MTIEDRIKEIENRIGRTTKGDWCVVKNDEPEPRYDLTIKTNEDEPWFIAEIVGGLEGDEESANAEYIAHSKQDITFLLSELKRCRKMVSQKYTCQGCGHTASLMGANEALHPEGVK